MSVTVRELREWIADCGLNDDSVITLDGDGTLVADIPGKTAIGYLNVGFIDDDEKAAVSAADDAGRAAAKKVIEDADRTA